MSKGVITYDKDGRPLNEAWGWPGPRNNETIPYYIQRFKLALVPAGKGLRLVSRCQSQCPKWEEEITLCTREDIVQELLRRVQVLAVEWTTPQSPRRHMQPAINRMERAAMWVQTISRNVQQLEWKTGVGVVDDQGRLYEHPIGCLPEVIWNIQRLYPADTVGLRWVHNRPPQVGGGVA